MYSVFLFLLERDGITVAEFSRATGIAQSTLANWKKRNGMISGKYAKTVADFFGVSVDFLMTGKHSSSSDDSGIQNIAEEISRRSILADLFSLAKRSSDENLLIVINLLEAMEVRDKQIRRLSSYAQHLTAKEK